MQFSGFWKDPQQMAVALTLRWHQAKLLGLEGSVGEIWFLAALNTLSAIYPDTPTKKKRTVREKIKRKLLQKLYARDRMKLNVGKVHKISLFGLLGLTICHAWYKGTLLVCAVSVFLGTFYFFLGELSHQFVWKFQSSLTRLKKNLRNGNHERITRK